MEDTRLSTTPTGQLSRPSIAAYLRERDRETRAVGGTSSRVRVLFRAIVPLPHRVPLRAAATTALTSWSRLVAKRLLAGGALRLHLGSARSRKDGWANVDLVGCGADLCWDLSRPMPFPDASVDAIFHEHLLEHLPLRAGFKLLEDHYRVLKPGGILRIGVPDAARYIRSYAAQVDDGFLGSVRPARPTPLLALQELFYGDGHRAMYDEMTLRTILLETGFREIGRLPFGDSRLRPCPDSPNREHETLYVEAVR